MVSIHVRDVSLSYRLHQKLTLGPSGKRMPNEGRLYGKGRTRRIMALDGVSFDLEAGDRLGLIGSNGAGKTTLLKILYGIYEPTGGEIEIKGRVDALFNINLGFRKEATGRRNIELRCLMNGWTKKQIAEHMESIIAFSELGEFIDVPIKAYSQGMSARLAFSIATSMDPEILLMDEWIGAGDPEFQAKARNRMEEMAEKAGIIVLASHNHNLIRRTCSKVLKLSGGKVEAFGTTEDVIGKNDS